MSKPTEGPYTCCETTLGHECIGFHITAPKFGRIAPLASKSMADVSYYPPEELRATGHLLAASWDLLKALEQIADDGVERSRDPRTLIARAAIAKAKGER